MKWLSEFAFAALNGPIALQDISVRLQVFFFSMSSANATSPSTAVLTQTCWKIHEVNVVALCRRKVYMRPNECIVVLRSQSCQQRTHSIIQFAAFTVCITAHFLSGFVDVKCYVAVHFTRGRVCGVKALLKLFFHCPFVSSD